MSCAKNKILYVITKASFGGAQKYVVDLASHMRAQGSEVVVAHGTNEFSDDNIFERALHDAGVRTIEVKHLGRDVRILSDIWAFFALVKIIRRENPSVVHLNSSKIGALGAVCARLLRLPKIVFTTHGLPFLQKRNPIAHVLVKTLSLFSVFLSTDTICVSRREFDTLHQNAWLRRKIRLIYNGLPGFHLRPTEDARRALAAKLPAAAGARTWIGSVSELRPNKGVHLTLQALAKLKESDEDFTYIHFGDGEEKAQLQRLVRDLDLDDRVHFLGFQKDAKSYLSALDVFVLSSLQEGLPYVLLEAGQAKVAVSATDVVGVGELVKHEQTGLLAPEGDVDGIERNLRLLLKDGATRNALAENLYQKVAQEFSVERMMDETEKLYAA